MFGYDATSPLVRTAVTLVVACMGAVLARVIHAPVYMLTGPAAAVSLAALAGLQVQIDPRFRNACFVVLGLTVGAGFNADALGTMARWPLAFIGVAALTWGTMVACRIVLVRGFGFARDTAILAGAPGHLSFVIAMAESNRRDVARISVTQSVRLLMLTLLVPMVALLLGVDMGAAVIPQGQDWPLWVLGLLGILAMIAATALRRVHVPAPLLIGAMVVAGIWQLSGVATGTMPQWLVLPAYLALGALIGTRFAGVAAADLWRNLGAGLAITAIAVVFAAVASAVTAVALGMPHSHVLLAFAPGGLETMIAMGVVMGVVPGFVAACHMTRLMVLSVLLPVMTRSGAQTDN